MNFRTNIHEACSRSRVRVIVGIAAAVVVGLKVGAALTANAAPTPLTTTLLGIEFVTIPPGKFTMGSPATEVGHDAREKLRSVEFRKPFLMANCETTVAQYRSLMQPGYRALPADARTPVTMVSWDDAVSYCKALSKKLGRTARLPYEDEWEYACRAGTTGPLAVWNGNLDADLSRLRSGSTHQFEQRASKVMNWGSNAVKPVGSYRRNAFGLCDMHGNVWEWCQKLSSSIDNDAPSLRQRPIRGGSWVSRDWADCRSAKRAWEFKDKRKESLGFRVLVETP